MINTNIFQNLIAKKNSKAYVRKHIKQKVFVMENNNELFSSFIPHLDFSYKIKRQYLKAFSNKKIAIAFNKANVSVTKIFKNKWPDFRIATYQAKINKYDKSTSRFFFNFNKNVKNKNKNKNKKLLKDRQKEETKIRRLALSKLEKLHVNRIITAIYMAGNIANLKKCKYMLAKIKRALEIPFRALKLRKKQLKDILKRKIRQLKSKSKLKSKDKLKLLKNDYKFLKNDFESLRVYDPLVDAVKKIPQFLADVKRIKINKKASAPSDEILKVSNWYSLSPTILHSKKYYGIYFRSFKHKRNIIRRKYLRRNILPNYKQMKKGLKGTLVKSVKGGYVLHLSLGMFTFVPRKFVTEFVSCFKKFYLRASLEHSKKNRYILKKNTNEFKNFNKKVKNHYLYLRQNSAIKTNTRKFVKKFMKITHNKTQIMPMQKTLKTLKILNVKKILHLRKKLLCPGSPKKFVNFVHWKKLMQKEMLYHSNVTPSRNSANFVLLFRPRSLKYIKNFPRNTLRPYLRFKKNKIKAAFRIKFKSRGLLKNKKLNKVKRKEKKSTFVSKSKSKGILKKKIKKFVPKPTIKISSKNSQLIKKYALKRLFIEKKKNTLKKLNEKYLKKLNKKNDRH